MTGANLHKIKYVFLPHRGVLTYGKPVVTDVMSSSKLPYSKEHILHMAASALAPSGHLLSDAVCNRAEELSVPYDSYGKSELYPGLGVETKIADANYLVGGRRFMEEKLIRLDSLVEAAQELSRQGKTTLFVAVDGSFVGLVVLEDKLRLDARPLIERLHRSGVTVVLSGDDHVLSLESAAKSLGIERVVSERTHQEISEYINRLRSGASQIAAVAVDEADKHFFVQVDHFAESLEELAQHLKHARARHFRSTNFTREEIIYRFTTFTLIALVLFPIFDLYISTVPALSAGILVSLAIQLGSYLSHNH